MIRMLIVDDEPYVVEAMKEALAEIEDLPLTLYTAIAAEEAMELMTRTKIDVVLSDIRMPGMTGLELQRWIAERWPRCKVVFLSGVNDFDYIQQALRHGGVDYVLKTEGDEAVERAIRGAIRAIREEALNEQALVRARNQTSAAMPLLRKAWFDGLMDPEGLRLNLTPGRMREAEVPLRSDWPVLLVAGRVDRWEADTTETGRMLLAYAIQNIAEEYLARLTLLPVMLEDGQFAWLIQPRTDEAPDWADALGFALGTLESIQATCGQLLKLPVSLVSAGEECVWTALPGVYRRLRQTMFLGLGDRTEMLITNCEAETREREPYRPLSDRQLAELDRILEMGGQKEWNALIDEIFAGEFRNYGAYAQTYYAIAVQLLRHINEWGGESAPVEGTVVKRLMDLDSHASKVEALAHLKDVAGLLLQGRQRTADERTHRIIQKLHRYIREHLADDLSLDALASVVFLNAAYLSVLYKQCTGANLSEYIAGLRIDRAKELLAGSPLKIHEIAVKVGFGTSGYFPRFFKRHTGLTPQEYRTAHDK